MVRLFAGIKRSKQFYAKANSHPANLDIVTLLREQSSPLILANLVPWSEVAFGARVHPELSDLVHKLAKTLPGCYVGLLYGAEVIGSPQGVLCAVATNISNLALRLPQYSHAEALQVGAKAIVKLGKDWIEFDAWQPHADERQQIEVLASWCKRAYIYACELG